MAIKVPHARVHRLLSSLYSILIPRSLTSLLITTLILIMAARIIPVCSLRDLLRNKSNAVRKVNAVVNAYDAIHSDPQNLDAVFEGQPIDGAVVVCVTFQAAMDS